MLAFGECCPPSAEEGSSAVDLLTTRPCHRRVLPCFPPPSRPVLSPVSRESHLPQLLEAPLPLELLLLLEVVSEEEAIRDSSISFVKASSDLASATTVVLYFA